MDFSQYPPELIQEMRRVRKQLAKIATTKAPCPNCDRQVNHFEAAGVPPDEFDFTKPPPFKCPGCGARLESVLSLLGGRHPYKWVATPARRAPRKRKEI
jgi:hypothetical protein